jgi:hypothetical protein
LSQDDTVDLQSLTHEGFAPLRGEAFEVSWQEGSTTFELVEVTARDDLGHAPGSRAPFSLVFRGPTAPALGQGTFLVQHDRLGRAALFLVPIAADEESRCYEACFG